MLSQGVQSSAPTMVPRASLLQANANATYQRPALVSINFFLVRIKSCRFVKNDFLCNYEFLIDLCAQNKRLYNKR